MTAQSSLKYDLVIVDRMKAMIRFVKFCLTQRRLRIICGYSQTKYFTRWNVDRHKLPVPATGIVAIAEALDRWSKVVDITVYRPAEVYRPGYYYEDKVIDCDAVSSHKYEAERLLLNEWAKDGLIRRVDQ